MSTTSVGADGAHGTRKVYPRWNTRRLTHDTNVSTGQATEMLGIILEQYQDVVFGRLARGAVHDGAASMRSASLHLSNARTAIQEGDTAKVGSSLSMISTSLATIESIFNDLAAYGCVKKEDFRRVSLRELVERTVEFLRPIFTCVITIEVRLPADGMDRFVQGDQYQLQQVLVNLMENAKNAFKGRAGKVTVSLHDIARGEDETLVPGSTQSPHVGISVADNAGGMSDEVLMLLDDRHFTTRGSGRGHGLGLFSVRRHVANHGGAITVSTDQTQKGEREAGSIFTVYLPAVR